MEIREIRGLKTLFAHAKYEIKLDQDLLDKLNIKEKHLILNKQKNQVELFREIFLGNINVNNFGKYLHEGWLLKRSISKYISNKKIDINYKKAILAGASGGKILGAGGGGFILFFSPIKKLALSSSPALSAVSIADFLNGDR